MTATDTNSYPSAARTDVVNGSGAEVEFISVPEWCARVGCSLDSGYRAARRQQIPGLFRIGRLMRVNWGAFVTSTAGAADDT